MGLSYQSPFNNYPTHSNVSIKFFKWQLMWQLTKSSTSHLFMITGHINRAVQILHTNFTTTRDLIVSRLECRPFVAPDGSVKVLKTPKNSNYHLSISCLRKADTCDALLLPEEIKTALGHSHKQLLSSEFGLKLN